MKNRSSLLASIALSLAVNGCSHPVTNAGLDPSGTPSSGPSARATAAPAPPTPKDLYRIPLDGLPSIGNSNALVTIVAFTDYQCPFCQRTEDTLTRLRTTYGDDVRIVVAERPLPMHDRARPAAIAALAAVPQGKYAEMRTRLFGQTGELDEASIAGAAKAAGLDIARWEADRNAVSFDAVDQLGTRFGVHGTPTFFVGGRRLVGAQPYEVFRDVVDERLAAARALVAAGVPRSEVYSDLIAAGADHAAAEAKLAGAGGCGGGEGSEGDCDPAGCAQDCNGPMDQDCNGPKDGPPPVGDVVEQVPTAGDPSRGPATASITIVAFSDFECPFCAKAEAVLHAIETAHPGDVRLVFKSLPLPFHVHARFAAKAALAADDQGHFWEFHDRLYARIGKSIDRAALEQIAGDVGLDVARFARDSDSAETEARIVSDKTDADALKVESTPTFFVNGRRVVGAQDVSLFEAAIAKSQGK
jgi:protein-disulfide isomerase